MPEYKVGDTNLSLKKSSLWFTFGTLLSRLLGLLRESILAGIFGASYLLDAFFVAYRLPNLLRDMAAEGALGASFTTVFTKTWEKDSQKAKQLIIEVVLFFGIVLSILSLIGIFFAPYLVKSLTIFGTVKRDDLFIQQTIQLTRLLFPFIIFMSISAILSGALHQRNRFFISAVSPATLNIGFIVGALFFASLFDQQAPNWIDFYFGNKRITGLACGVLLGGLFQTVVLFFAVKKSFFSKKIIWKKISVWNTTIKKIIILMGPMIIASSSGLINVMVNTNFATSLESGTVSWLNFSFRILQLPIGLFAVAISTAILPSISKLVTQPKNKKHAAILSSYQSAIDLTLWLLIPCSCFIMINHYSIIDLIFNNGKFSTKSTEATSEALFFYSIGLLGYGFHKVLTSFYYSLDKTNYAMKVSVLSIVINFLTNYLLVHYLGYKGLALTTSIIMNINTLLLFYGLYKDHITYPFQLIKKNCILLITAITLSTIFQKYALNNISIFFGNVDIHNKIKTILILGTNAILIIFIFLFFSKFYYINSYKK